MWAASGQAQRGTIWVHYGLLHAVLLVQSPVLVDSPCKFQQELSHLFLYDVNHLGQWMVSYLVSTRICYSTTGLALLLTPICIFVRNMNVCLCMCDGVRNIKRTLPSQSQNYVHLLFYAPFLKNTATSNCTVNRKSPIYHASDSVNVQGRTS